MKSKLLSLFCLLAALNAWAGHDGPSGAPKPPGDGYIAEVTTGGGLTPPQYPVGIFVGVRPDGEVVRESRYMDGHVKIESVTTLSAAALDILRKDIVAAKPGQLVDPHPTEPSCVDAPVVRYAISQGTLELGRIEGCKELRKVNLSTEEARILNALRGLKELSYLLPQ